VTDTAKLVVRMSDGSVQEHELDGDVFHIGRDPASEIQIPSRYVSRRHARVRRTDTGFVIEDEQSTNGLQINGSTVREPHPLVTGDCVVLGDVSLTYEGPDADALLTVVYTAPASLPPPALDAGDATPVLAGRGGTRRPAGLCSILFTDLVDHTRQVTRVGDLAGQVWLRRHSAILREQFEQHGGIEEKWTGDGFVVTFDSARRALQCAIAIQRATREHNAGAVDGLIQVRIGLNTGEVLREEGELFGNAVILAARIMSEAGAGEILISELMYHVVQPGGDIDAIDRGLFTLKGFPQEQRLFQVVWPEAGAGAP
jgi:class 3 adenylate cyclase